MITDIQFESALNLAVDNDVMNNLRLPADNIFAGVSWIITTRPRYESLQAVLGKVYHLISQRLPEHRVWLLIGDSAWIPDTRITRYRYWGKLWDVLAKSGIEILYSSNLEEVIVQSNGEFKSFGATQLSELSINSVTKILLDRRCAYIAALPNNVEIKTVLEVGWSGYFENDSSLIEYIYKLGGLLIRKFGEFDDIETGMTALGSPEIVKAIL